MRAKRNAFNVGLVTILVTLTAFAILLWISKGVSGDMKRITIKFDSTPAMPTLVKGSEVFVGGQRIGKVHKATLTEGPAIVENGKERHTFVVIVEANILTFVKLRSDCRVFAEGPPLGGDGIVKIDLGKAVDEFPADKIIEGAAPGGFAAIIAGLQSEFDSGNPAGIVGLLKAQLDPQSQKTLMGKLLKSLADVNDMTASLSRELSPEQKTALLAKLHSVADHINDMTGALRTEFDSQKPDMLLGRIHVAVNSVNDSLDTMKHILQNNEGPIDRTMASVERTAQNIAAETDPANAVGLMAQFKKAGTSLNVSLDDVNSITGATRQVVVLNKENLNRMLINFKETSDHLRSGMKYVLRHPWRLMNAPALAEIKQEAIFDAARSFAEAATRVDDAASQLKALAELNHGNIPTNHPDLARIKADLELTQQNYRKAENELWRQLGISGG